MSYYNYYTQYVPNSSLQSSPLSQPNYQGQPLFQSQVSHQPSHFIQQTSGVHPVPVSQGTAPTPYLISVPGVQTHLPNAYVHSQHGRNAANYSYPGVATQNALKSPAQQTVVNHLVSQPVLHTPTVPGVPIPPNTIGVPKMFGYPTLQKEPSLTPENKALPIMDSKINEPLQKTQSKAVAIIDPATGKNLSPVGTNKRLSEGSIPTKEYTQDVPSSIVTTTSSNSSSEKSKVAVSNSLILEKTISQLPTRKRLYENDVVQTVNKSENSSSISQEMEDIYSKFAKILEEGPLEPTSQKILGQFIKLSTTERKKVMTQGSIKAFLLNCSYIDLQHNHLVLNKKEYDSVEESSSCEKNQADQSDDYKVQKFEDEMWKHGIFVQSSNDEKENVPTDVIIKELSDLTFEKEAAEIDDSTVRTVSRSYVTKQDQTELDKLRSNSQRDQISSNTGLSSSQNSLIYSNCDQMKNDINAVNNVKNWSAGWSSVIDDQNLNPVTEGIEKWDTDYSENNERSQVVSEKYQTSTEKNVSDVNRNNSNVNVDPELNSFAGPQFLPKVFVSPKRTLISPVSKAPQFNIGAEEFQPKAKKNLTHDFLEDESKNNSNELNLQFQQVQIRNESCVSSDLKASSPEFKPKGFIPPQTLKLQPQSVQIYSQGTNTVQITSKDHGAQCSIEVYDTCINTVESIFDPCSEVNLPIVHTKDIGTGMPEKCEMSRNTQTGKTGKGLLREKSCQTDAIEVHSEKITKNEVKMVELKVATIHLSKAMALKDLKYRSMGLLEEIKSISELHLLSEKEKSKLLEELESAQEELEKEMERVTRKYTELTDEVRNGKELSADEYVLPYEIPALPHILSQLNQRARSQMDLLTSVLDTLPPEENSKIIEVINSMLPSEEVVNIPEVNKTSTYYKKNFLEMEHMNAQYRLRLKYIAIYENYVLLTEREDMCISCSERHPLMKDFDRVTSSYKASQKNLKSLYEDNLKKIDEEVALKDLPPMTFRIPACPSTFIIPSSVSSSKIDELYESLYECLAGQLDKEFPPATKPEEPVKGVEEILREISEIENNKKTTKTKKKAKKKRAKSAHRDSKGVNDAELFNKLKMEALKSTATHDSKNQQPEGDVPSNWEERFKEPPQEKKNKVQNDLLGKMSNLTCPNSQETDSSELPMSENSTPSLSMSTPGLSSSENSTPGLTRSENSTPGLTRSENSTPGLSRSENSTPGLTRSENSTPGLTRSENSTSGLSNSINVNTENESNPNLFDQNIIFQQYQPLLNNMMMALIQSNTSLMFHPQLLQNLAIQHLMIMLKNQDSGITSMGLGTTPLIPSAPFPNLLGNMMGQNIFPGMNAVPTGLDMLHPAKQLAAGSAQNSSNDQNVNASNVPSKESPVVDMNTISKTDSKKSDKRVSRTLPPGITVEIGDLNAIDKDEMVPVGKKTRSNSLSESVEVLDKSVKKSTSKVVKVKTSAQQKSSKKSTSTKLSRKPPGLLSPVGSDTATRVNDEFQPAMNVGNLNFSGGNVPFTGNRPDSAATKERRFSNDSNTSEQVAKISSETVVRPKTGLGKYNNNLKGSFSSTSSLDSWDTAPAKISEQHRTDSSRSSPYESVQSSRDVISNCNAVDSEDWEAEADPYATGFKLNSFNTHTKIKQQSEIPTVKMEPKPNVWSKPLFPLNAAPRHRSFSDRNRSMSRERATSSPVAKALPIVASSIKTVPVNVVKKDKGPVPITPLDLKDKINSVGGTNPFTTLGRTHKPRSRSASKEKTRVSEKEPIDIESNDARQVEKDAWQQVPGKRGRKRENSFSGSNVNLVGRKMVSLIDKPEEESKSTHFDRLISIMKEKFPKLERPEIIKLINDVRTSKGSLKGMSVADIIYQAEVLVKKESKPKVDFIHVTSDGTVDVTKTRLYKTVLCEHWKNGTCKKSAQDCVYAHGKEELNEGPRNILCPAIKKGEDCQYGEKCMYSHSVTQVQGYKNQRTGSGDFASVAKSWVPETARPYDVVQSDEEPDAEQCSICLELIRTGCGNRLECGHVYHDSCIKDWINKRQMTCPVCRTHSLLCEDFPKLGS